MSPDSSPLLTDLYQLNMLQAYLENGRTGTAVFEFFVRKLPERRGFLMAAGLEQAIEWLEQLRFSDEELAWLAGAGRFTASLLDELRAFRFTGDVDAVPEGAVVFENEPLLRVTAPLPEAQLVETRLINILHYQTVVASKAARMVLAAPGKSLVDFGLRRAHGAEAGLMAARASYIAGFDATATMLANARFGIPLSGTMAHSFIQVFDEESAAFEAFARARPENLVLLIDTYDVEAAARKVVALAPKLTAAGITIRSVRLDSGDLVALSRSVRAILDAGGLQAVTIFASGGLDEDNLAVFAKENAPIDGLGIGTAMTTSSDAPSLDIVYKLQEYAGVPRRKRSANKATWPGRKQVWRRYGADGRMASDLLALETASPEAATRDGETLVRQVMRNGKRLATAPSLEDIRAHSKRELERLPEPLRQLDPHASYPVEVAMGLRELAEEVDRRLLARQAHDRS